jgi:hypothetical protein
MLQMPKEALSAVRSSLLPEYQEADSFSERDVLHGKVKQVNYKN